MKHAVKKRKLGREKGPREALIRSLAISLIEKGKITTTMARAKEIRPFVEKLVTRSRISSVANRRLISARLGGHDEVVKKLFEEVSPRYSERPGGYLRIVKVAPRKSDASPMAIIEFV